MPRYLALDYLAKVVENHKSLLNRMLLSEPQHLELVDVYTHKGVLPDTRHRKPWKKAPINYNVLAVTDKDIEIDLKTLCSKKSDVETFCSGNLFHTGPFSLIEVVPSSNPDSQESICDEVLTKLVDGHERSQNYNEVILKEPLESTGCEMMTLEDIECVCPLKQYLVNLHITALSCLLNRQRVRVVSDPFNDINGVPFKEETLFQNDRVFKCDEISLVGIKNAEDMSAVEENVEESLNKHQLFNTSLEEQAIVPEIMAIGKLAHITKDILQEQKELLEKEYLGPEEDEDAMKTKLNQILENESTAFVEKLKLPCQPPKISCSELYTLIEKDYEPQKDLGEEALSIDVPCIIASRLYSINDRMPWRTLNKSDAMIPIDKGENMPVLLSPRSQQAIEQELWHRDRYCIDGNFLLKVPGSMAKQSLQHINMAHVLNLLEVKMDHSSLGALELDLPWDPLEAHFNGMMKTKKSEQLFGTKTSSCTIFKPLAEVGYQSEDMDQFSLKGEEVGEIMPLNVRKKVYHPPKLYADKSNIDPLCCTGAGIEQELQVEDTPAISSASEMCVNNSLKQLDSSQARIVLSPKKALSTSIDTSSSSSYDSRKEPYMIGKCVDVSKSSNKDKLSYGILKKTNSGDVKTDNQLKDQITKKNNGIAQPQPPCAELNPVAAFMMMRGIRTVFSGTPGRNVPTVAVAPSPVQNEKDAASKEKKIVDLAPSKRSPASAAKAKKRSKLLTVPVTLTDSFRSVLKCLEGYAQPLLSNLKSQGLVPQNTSLLSMMAETSQLTLKSYKPKTADQGQIDKDTVMDVNQLVLALNCLKSAADVLIHCSLKSATLHLSYLQEKHGDTLKGILENVRQYLFKAHFLHDQKQIMHPKISALISTLTDWLQRKKKKSPEHDPKVLVVLKRNSGNLLTVIEEALAAFDLKPITMKCPFKPEDVLIRLDKYNCMLICSSQIAENFPWAQFSLVLEYEVTKDSTLVYKSCARQGIRYIAIQMVFNERKEPDEQIKELLPETPGSSMKQKESDQLVLIGSQDLTNHPEILQLMETRHNILIMDRNYTELSSQSGVRFADIILDERTCVILKDMKHFKEQNQDVLLIQMAALKLKYEKCWILLYNSVQNQTKYQFEESFLSKLTTLHSIAGQFSKKQDDYRVKLVLCSSAEEAAQTIHRLTDYSCKNSKVRSAEEWVARKWIKPEISPQEKWLLTIPCLNSYSAQHILKTASLNSLAQMDLDQMTTTYKLPNKVTKYLWLYLRRTDENSCMRNVRTEHCRGSTNEASGSSEQCGGSTGKASGSSEQHGGSTGKASGTLEHCGGSTVKASGSWEQREGSIGKALGSSGQLGGSTGKALRSSEQRGGSAGKVSGSSLPDEVGYIQASWQPDDWIETPQWQSQYIEPAHTICDEQAKYQPRQLSSLRTIAAKRKFGTPISEEWLESERYPELTDQREDMRRMDDFSPSDYHTGMRPILYSTGQKVCQDDSHTFRTETNTQCTRQKPWLHEGSEQGVPSGHGRMLPHQYSSSMDYLQAEPPEARPNTLVDGRKLWTHFGDSLAHKPAYLNTLTPDSDMILRETIEKNHQQESYYPLASFRQASDFGQRSSNEGTNLSPERTFFMGMASKHSVSGIASVPPRIKEPLKETLHEESSAMFRGDINLPYRRKEEPRSRYQGTSMNNQKPRKDNKAASTFFSNSFSPADFSPPMDYVEGLMEREESASVWQPNEPPWHHGQQGLWHNTTGKQSSSSHFEEMGHGFSKRRRLTFEKMPGARGGQTRLTFSKPLYR